jgi:hypothetical protein
MAYKSKTAEIVINELRSVNREVEELLSQLPTNDHHIIGRLYALTIKQKDLISVTVSNRERGTMFLEQERRIASFLIHKYNHAVFTGNLHQSDEEQV